MKKPNFFIVGAPKCGTTALSEYLRNHPNIFMSVPKEPHYFSTDMKPYCFSNTLEEYLSLFSESKSEHIAIGEASVLYLYSKDAIKNIFTFDQNARIIVMLRNPIDYIYSFHSQLVLNCDETEIDFQKAWHLKESRKKGENINKNHRIPKLLYYDEVAKLGSQVNRLLAYFPQNQVHFILMDDFQKNTLDEYKKVLKFLNIPYDGRNHFPRINENKTLRSVKIAKLKRSNIFKFLRKLKSQLGLSKLPLLGWLYNWNKIKTKRKPLDANFRNELLATFLPEIEKLEELLKTDLSHWKNL